jgi:hypothetical protein
MKTMINKFPNIQAVRDYKSGLYIVQQLAISAIDGAKFYMIYIQDMHTFEIVYYDLFEKPIKTPNAGLFLVEYLKSLEEVDLTDLTFVFLKSTPFTTLLFLKVLEGLGVNYSYYKRSETLIQYEVARVCIKGYIIDQPDSISDIIKRWNKQAEAVLPKEDNQKNT